MLHTFPDQLTTEISKKYWLSQNSYQPILIFSDSYYKIIVKVLFRVQTN